MRTAILNLQRAWQTFGQTCFVPRSRGFIVAVASLLAAASLPAATTVNTLGGGAPSKYYGYKNGNTLSQALFHTPSGLCLDATGTQLLVADRDNNAIRILDLTAGNTYTFGIIASNAINKPVGVVADSFNNVFVLDRGNGNNGMVVEFNNFGDLVATNAAGLTNANGMALDIKTGNIYVTVRSNTLLRISGLIITNIATISTPGTLLQGIVVKQNGLIAACDSGRHGILLIDPATGNVTTNAGFHGVGDFAPIGVDAASSSTAKFRQPMSVAEAGDGTLIVTDYGNHRIKAVLNSGVVTNISGVSSNFWVKGTGKFPGWADGSVIIPDQSPDAESRLPFGVVFGPDGSIYTSEDFYHVIRKITGANLPLPPVPPPPPSAPRIGWFDYEFDTTTGLFLSTLHPVVGAITFHNDAMIAIDPGVNGIETFYITTNGPVPVPTVPSALNGSTPPVYQDRVTTRYSTLPVTTIPDMVVKAVNVNSAGVSSPVITSEFLFQCANPTIIGNNGAQFTISDITTNVTIWYTIDGTIPTNGPPSLGGIALTNGNSVTLSLSVTTNVLFQARAFRPGYAPSGIAPQTFSPANFLPNSITFGFTSGEASSDFVASPGQRFYAPVTLSILPNTVMDSLQFSLAVSSIGGSAALTPGAFAFQSMLMKPIPGTTPIILTNIPPAMFVAGTGFTNLESINTALGTIAVGWLERQGQTNLFNTLAQSLITFSIAHDDMFPSPLQPNGVIIGGYSFIVPANAAPGDSYQIQISRPTATTDGIGEPGSSVFILAPTNGSTGGGTANSVKNVVVGQRKYIVGDAAPFRWFNAGDFGNTNLESADVAQVFEAAVYGFNTPPIGSDLFDSMDSCGFTYSVGAGGYLVPNAPVLNTSVLFNGNDATIDQIAFGNGILDVADVYVTYRRSLQTNLVWFQRFWTNDTVNFFSGRVAEIVPNIFNPNVSLKPSVASKALQSAGYITSPDSITNQPRVTFVAGDFQATAGQTVQIPITASIVGNYPLRVLMLNLTVVPIDGSPALTAPVSFSYNPALGTPWTTEQRGNGNYSAVWLNNNIDGLSNNVSIGTLTVTIPANATSQSAYAVHFDHASASPNGLASFPKQVKPGLVTLSNRSGSSFNDGIPDSWRLRYFLTLNNLLSATNADADGDGMNNLQEYAAGTDPTDPQSLFKNIGSDPSAATQPSDCVISWPSVVGKQYVIECSASLASPTWTSIGTNSGNGGVMEYHDTSGSGVRYYRVRVQ